MEDVNIVTIPRIRHGESDCVKAKEVELNKLKEFDTFVEVEDNGQTRITTTWVLWWKGDIIRARLVARGFEETESIRSDSPTVDKSSIRLILALCTSKGWQVQTTDVKSAFLQGKELDRNVFLVPPKEARVGPGKLWKLKHCLYGLNDAARQFYTSVVDELTALGCTQSKLDPALFYLRVNGQLAGIIASHIDDFLHVGNEEFESRVMIKLRNRFLAGKVEASNFRYVGFTVTQMNRCIVLDQNEYTESLEPVNVSPHRMSQKQSDLTPQESTTMRSLAGKLNWIVQGTRPDMAFDLIELSTRFRRGIISDLLQGVKALRRIKEAEAKVCYPALGHIENWRLVVFSDAAHANLNDGVSSTGAHIVLLVGSDKRCCPLAWHANKIKRVVRSTIAAEALSLLEGLETGMYLRTLLEEVVGVNAKSIPLLAFVDNRSVVEAIYSTKMVDDKRLRIDLGAIKECLNTHAVHSKY
jgi:hypothetical protein